MTDVDKLKALFKIAEENECDEHCSDFAHLNKESLQVSFDTGYYLINKSLNDIVGDWEPNQISFLQALIFAESNISVEDCEAQAHHVRTCWFKLPSSLRLEYLFECFKNLIDESFRRES